MRDRLIYILKHNQLIQHIYKISMSFIFKILGCFIKTDENIVLFISFMGKGYNDSPKIIYEYLQNHDEYRDLICMWAFEHPENYPDLNSIKIDSLTYFMTALKAKYWITNTNIERGLTFKKKNQIYLNTWHGIALKYIGNDCPGRKDFNFDTVNYLTVSGKYDEKVFKTAFNANNKSYLRCGMPRNEALWNVKKEEKSELREKLLIPKDKKVILYAPTWRESIDGGKTYAIKPPIDFDKWEKRLSKDYIVLFRAHHQTTNILGVKYNDFVRNVSDYSQVNDLMIVADILITDYSAIAFDFSILCKPIFVYAYDYTEYLKKRGTYFEIDEKYPNKACRTEEELLSRIENLDYEKECKNTRKFRDAFIQYGGNATRICVDKVFGERI